MGILRNLFGGAKKTNDNQHLLEKVQVSPDLQLSKAFASYGEEIEKTRLPFVRIDAVPNNTLSSFQSSFGYYPALPKEFPYPTDSEGNFLFPLAQINFSEMPALPGFPTSGYLQFYISGAQNVYGIDFEDGQSQKDFRVLFFEEEEVSDPITDFSFLELDNSDKHNVPLREPHSLSYSLQQEYMGYLDIRFEKQWTFYSTFKQQYPEIAKELDNELFDTFSASGHKISGYAYFTQWDPRDEKHNTADYILLLQIDSDDHILWSDFGVGNFFIHPDDLRNKDFSKVLYHWDCC